MSVWGNESSFGEVLTNNRVMRNVFRSLATLGWGEPRRKSYWEGELLNALTIVERGWADPREMVGSWAGAMGHTQFMPEAWLRIAVDFDGDGRRNLFRVPDALASTARFLRERGRWQTGQPWGFEVAPTPGFDANLADGTTARSLSRWASLGLARADGGSLAGEAEARVRFPAGVAGPGFLTLQNFRAFMAYNPSFLYALAVGHLADRIRGAGPFIRPWPGMERPLSTEDMAEIQRRLTAAGFDTGGTDGRVGDMTRRAVRGFQERNGMAQTDGFPDSLFLDRIRQLTPEPQRNFLETLFGGGR
jgi:membrane-bound lytic murein transglycosylase B